MNNGIAVLLHYDLISVMGMLICGGSIHIFIDKELFLDVS